MANRIRLGDLLVRAGLVKESDLRAVLGQQKQSGGRLGEHLVRSNLCSEEQIARALAHQLGLIYNELADEPLPAVTALVPGSVAVRLQVLPVAYDEGSRTLSIAVSDPLDDEAIAEVARTTGRQVEVQVTPALSLRAAIEQAYAEAPLRELPPEPAPPAAPEVVLYIEEEDLPGEAPAEPVPLADDPLPPLEAETDPLRLTWAVAELLIERGFFSRADLMKKLRR